MIAGVFIAAYALVFLLIVCRPPYPEEDFSANLAKAHQAWWDRINVNGDGGTGR